jgi:quercetin dioxygenase-like cupin family protein
MKIYQLLENLTFHPDNPYAEPLSVDGQGRILRFSLRPGQSIREHQVPSSPFIVIVIKGHGIFTGAGGEDQKVGPDALIEFVPGETHSVRALDEELIFVGILHTVPDRLFGQNS